MNDSAMASLAWVAVRQQRWCQRCLMGPEFARPPEFVVGVAMPCKQCTPTLANVPATFRLCQVHLDELLAGHLCPHGIAMIVSEPIEIPVEERK